MAHAKPEIPSETPSSKMSNPNRRQSAQVEEHDERVNDENSVREKRIDESHLDKRVLCKRKFLNNPPANQMLLNDPLEHLRSARVIPDRFRIDDRDWPVHADSEAIRLGAINQRFGPDQLQF